MFNSYMNEAIRLAEIAGKSGEIPVGAVVVQNGEIIAAGYNLREKTHSAAAHAEIVALSRAGEKLKRWQLYDCDLYVTLQPCEMCRGAIAQARFKSVYFGAYDKKAGSVGSLVNLFDLPYNHKPSFEGGVEEEKCAEILSDFFAQLRLKKKK